MRDAKQGLQNRFDHTQARDRAIHAFLNLGDKIKEIANRDARRDATEEDSAKQLKWLGAQSLFNTIEGEIIPRLMLAHRGAAPVDGDAAPQNEISIRDREQFLHLVIQEDGVAATQFCEELLQRGVARDDLFLDLLSGAARRLGEMWEQDVCDFTDVTIGLCRLHEVVRRQTADSITAVAPADHDAPSVLLATACGDQHVFGVVIVADFFRRAGWRVVSAPGAKQDELAELLGKRRFDVLGLSAACSVIADGVATEITALRKASRNKDLKVLVGGRLFAESEDLVEQVGAHAFAGVASAAPEIGAKLLAANAARC